MATRKQEVQVDAPNPLKSLSWLGPVLGSLAVSAVISFVSSPVSRLDRIEARVQLIEVAKAGSDAQAAALREALADLKTQMTLLNNKLDDLKADSAANRAAQISRK